MRILGRRVRLRWIVLAAVAVGVGSWLGLASRSLDENLLYAYSPGDLVAANAPTGDIRVGGQVAPGSVRWNPDTRVLRFTLREGGASVPVLQRGAPPALFKAGQGAIVEGRLVDGVLVSSNLIVRHDNTYRPPSTSEGQAAR